MVEPLHSHNLKITNPIFLSLRPKNTYLQIAHVEQQCRSQEIGYHISGNKLGAGVSGVGWYLSKFDNLACSSITIDWGFSFSDKKELVRLNSQVSWTLNWCRSKSPYKISEAKLRPDNSQECSTENCLDVGWLFVEFFESNLTTKFGQNLPHIVEQFKMSIMWQMLFDYMPKHAHHNLARHFVPAKFCWYLIFF